MINNNIDKIKSLISKHGLFKSLNILVDGKETIKQIYINNPSDYLNLFNDLKPIQKDNKICYINNNNLILFFYYSNNKNNYVYINYDKIWALFSDILKLNYDQIQNIISNWLKEIYNIIDLIPLNTIPKLMDS